MRYPLIPKFYDETDRIDVYSIPKKQVFCGADQENAPFMWGSVLGESGKAPKNTWISINVWNVADMLNASLLFISFG